MQCHSDLLLINNHLLAMSFLKQEPANKCKNKWGQININSVNERAERLRGASSYWSTRNRSAPLSLSTLSLGINVDLTPIFLATGALLQLLASRCRCGGCRCRRCSSRCFGGSRCVHGIGAMLLTAHIEAVAAFRDNVQSQAGEDSKSNSNFPHNFLQKKYCSSIQVEPLK